MKTHGGSSTVEYRTWQSMLNRCYNKNVEHYESYGGRGIAVCDEWRNSFSAFLSDMGIRPSPNHSIERKNNDLGYSPDNCYWATKTEQQRNRRNVQIIEYNGVSLPVKVWAKQLGIAHATLRQRLKYGWSIELALTMKPHEKKSSRW
jgi:hypothetical protein